MFRRRVRNEVGFIARRCAPAVILLAETFMMSPALRAQIDLGPITVGAGLQTSFEHTQPDSGSSTDQFLLNSARIYINGPVTKDIKFMFNTEYDGATNKIGILDAAAQISVSPMFNIWAGRFLPPSDRANLYGPYYSHEWKTYTDGIQDGYPFIFQGRDNGVMYWGDFGKKVQMKVSAGVFDGKTATGNSKVLSAARVQFDFWDREEGYYLNGTYYGDKNILALGGATEVQSGHTATTVDFLLEKKLSNKGSFTIESEYARYNRLGGYDAAYAKSQGAYVLGSYLFPKQVGVGKFEILGKYAKADFTHGIAPSYNQKTTEINFNYVIKQFNARVMSFFEDTRFNRIHTDFYKAGIGLQIQM